MLQWVAAKARLDVDGLFLHVQNEDIFFTCWTRGLGSAIESLKEARKFMADAKNQEVRYIGRGML